MSAANGGHVDQDSFDQLDTIVVSQNADLAQLVEVVHGKRMTDGAVGKAHGVFRDWFGHSGRHRLAQTAVLFVQA